MILYHMGHYGLFSQCITHSMAYHAGEEIVFLIDEILASKEVRDFLQRQRTIFQKKGIGRIITYSDKPLMEMQSREELLTAVRNQFDCIFEKEKITLHNVKQIYSGFDTYDAFGIYLNEKKLSYSLIEIYAGQYEENRYMPIHPKQKTYAELQKDYRVLSADNPYVKNVFRKCNGVEQPKTDSQKVIYVDYQGLEQSFSKTQKEKIRTCFGLDILEKGKEYAVIFCSSFWIKIFLKQTLQDYQKVYSLLADLCAEKETVLLKAHPNSELFQKDWNENLMILSGVIPSSYLFLDEEIKIKKIISTGSTAANSSYPNIKYMDFPLKEIFENLQRFLNIYVTLQIAKVLCDAQYNYHAFRQPFELLNAVNKNFFDISKKFLGMNPKIIKGNVFCMVSSLNTKELVDSAYEAVSNADKDSMVCFLDKSGEAVFEKSLFHEAMRNSFRKIIVEEKPNVKWELIFFCKNPLKLQKLEAFHEEKALKISGSMLKIYAEKFHKEQIYEKQIAVLYQKIQRQEKLINTMAKEMIKQMEI